MHPGGVVGSVRPWTKSGGARVAPLAGLGWDVQRQGLCGAPALTVMAGEKAHSTLSKALGLIGLGRDRVHRVPADEQGRMRAELLPPYRRASHRVRTGRRGQHRGVRSVPADRVNVTYDSGIVFLRSAEHLRRSFASVADYLPPDNGFEAMHHTPQSSQRARQIEVWAVLRCLGRTGIANLVATTCRRARRIGDALAQAGKLTIQ